MASSRVALLTIVLALSALVPNAAAGTLCESILTQRKMIEKNEFITGRELKDYLAYLGPGFREALIKLRADGHWIDMGAGGANAVMGYLTTADPRFPDPAERAHVTAVAVQKPHMNEKLEKQALSSGKYKYLEGRYVEDIPVQEFGRADLITDFYGPLAYSMDPVGVLNAYLKILKVGGSIYFVEGNRTLVHDRNTEYSFNAWLKVVNVPGLEVELGHFAPRITKLAEDVSIPELELFSFSAERPPYRDLRGPTAAPDTIEEALWRARKR